MDYRVTHIIPDSSDPDGRIDAIFGPLCGLVYQNDAILRIDSRMDSFYTYEFFYRANVFVASRYGTRFLTTSPDGFGPNNLCKLPRYSG